MQTETAPEVGGLERLRNVFGVYRPIAVCTGRETHRAIAQYLIVVSYNWSVSLIPFTSQSLNALPALSQPFKSRTS